MAGFYPPGRRAGTHPAEFSHGLHAVLQQHLFGEGGRDQAKNDRLVRILARLRLRSQFIWIETARRERVYLNAEHLGVMGRITGRELAMPLLDPQRAADLEMFFYLVVKIQG